MLLLLHNFHTRCAIHEIKKKHVTKRNMRHLSHASTTEPRRGSEEVRKKRVLGKAMIFYDLHADGVKIQATSLSRSLSAAATVTYQYGLKSKSVNGHPPYKYRP